MHLCWMLLNGKCPQISIFSSAVEKNKYCSHTFRSLFSKFVGVAVRFTLHSGQNPGTWEMGDTHVRDSHMPGGSSNVIGGAGPHLHDACRGCADGIRAVKDTSSLPGFSSNPWFVDGHREIGFALVVHCLLGKGMAGGGGMHVQSPFPSLSQSPSPSLFPS